MHEHFHDGTFCKTLLSDTKRDRTERERRIDSLERENQELRERVKLLETSTSWRITAPLRAVKECLLKIKSQVTRKFRIGSTARLPSWDAVGQNDLGPNALCAASTLENGGCPQDPGIARDRVLILEHRVPTPDRTSASLRLWEMVRAICSLGKSVTFGSDYPPAKYRWLLRDVEELLSYVQALRDLGTRTLLGEEEIINHLKQCGRAYKHVILSYPEIMYQYLPAVRVYAPQAHVIYDTVDLHGLRFEREARIKGGAELWERARHYQKMENANLRLADTVIAITEHERKTILDLVPDADVTIIPNIHIVTDEPLPPPAHREGLLFIGHYLHNPNADAVAYFVSEILPLVKQQLPGVKFFMIGSSMTEDILGLASEEVKAIGYVPDPAPYFRRCRVFVAPLRFGAGMMGKIGQSISLGLPVVTTSIGAEGMGLVDGESVLIGDSPSEFADAVVRLYTDDDLWMAVAHKARELIHHNFSPQEVQRQIGALLHSVPGHRVINT